MTEKKRGGKSGQHPWRDDPWSNTVRPPFEPGNEKAMIHGAESPRKLAPIAKELEEQVTELVPWTARPAFRASVAAWAWAEAECTLYRAYFEEHGLWEPDGEPARGLVRWDRAEVRAAALRKRLALDPTALASLLLKLTGVENANGDSSGLQAVKAEGSAIVAARERQLLGRDDEEGDGDD